MKIRKMTIPGESAISRIVTSRAKGIFRGAWNVVPARTVSKDWNTLYETDDFGKREQILEIAG